MTQNKELGKGKVIQHKMENKWNILQKVEKMVEDMLHKNGEKKEIERMTVTLIDIYKGCLV